MSKLLTPTQAAKLVSKSPSTIRRMIKEKKIVSEKTEKGWNVVSKESLLAAFAEASKDNHYKQTEETEYASNIAVKVFEKQLENANEIIQSLLTEKQKLIEENFRLTKRQEEQFQAWKSEMESILKKNSGNSISRWLRI